MASLIVFPFAGLFITDLLLSGVALGHTGAAFFYEGEYMLNDLDIIIRDYPQDFEYLNVYAIGDVHVGAPEFNERAIKKKIQMIADDPFGTVCLCGDLGNFGLRNSKTNSYFETLSPRQQIEYIYELFLPITDKISACVPGNHEERITREVGTCPMYDLCVRWDIPEIYRENVAITKYTFGHIPGQKKRNAFFGITMHGSSRNKHRKFTLSFDNVDFGISGHTHTPEYSPRGRIRINTNYATAKHVPYKELVVDANLTPGGYGMKKEYEIPAPPELQYLRLSSYREATPHHTIHKVIDYHAIQL